MTIKAVYFDDEVNLPGRFAQRVRDLLAKDGELSVELRYPPSFTELEINFDIVLVDLDLSTPAPNGVVSGYYGTTLASELRMRNPSCPIVLITRPNMIMGKNQLLEDSMDVDLILFKDDINKDPESNRKKIIFLYEGFQTLSSSDTNDWTSVLNLMRASESEGNLLREAAPPMDKGSWTVPRMAHWIRNVVMEYPGILYNELTAATRLGITLKDFQSEKVQQFLSNCRYTGVFSSFGPRWWRERVLLSAQEIALEHDKQGPVSETFREAFKDKFGLELKPATCIYDGTPTADWVCYIFKEPVKQRNSIPYYPDNRPQVMDQARVSFKAIQESDDFDETLVDAESYEKVKELWE